MKLENGYIGIKRIYKAELLQLFAAVFGIIASVVTIIIGAKAVASDVSDGEAVTGLAGLLLLLVAGILVIVAFFMNLAGVSRAAKDSGSFKAAFFFTILGIVASILSTIFGALSKSWSGTASDVAEVVKSVSELLATLYIVDGIAKFSDELGQPNVRSLCNKYRIILMILYILVIAIVVVSIILRATTASATAVSVMGIVSAVLSIVLYFMYLTLLRKAKNMWENK